MDVRYGHESDFEWLQEHDEHVNHEWIKRCLHHGEYILAVDEKNRRGFLRFSMFWGNIPYMDLIWITKNYREKGIGSSLFLFWEKEMKKRKAKVLMTSSMLDEPEPQKWHKRNGFMKCGQITFGQEQPTSEIFFVKDLE
mgnify:CR=1 FL=1